MLWRKTSFEQLLQPGRMVCTRTDTCTRANTHSFVVACAHACKHVHGLAMQTVASQVEHVHRITHPCIRTHKCTHAHTRTHNSHMYTHIQYSCNHRLAHICTRTHIRTYTHVHVHKHTHTCTMPHKQACMHARTRTSAHTHTRTRACQCVRMHGRTHSMLQRLEDH